MNSFAIVESVNEAYLAVGMLFLNINAFDQSLLASICAPFLLGPKHNIPSADKTSAIPSANGSSGPTATRSILFDLHQTAMPLKLRKRKQFCYQL